MEITTAGYSSEKQYMSQIRQFFHRNLVITRKKIQQNWNFDGIKEITE